MTGDLPLIGAAPKVDLRVLASRIAREGAVAEEVAVRLVARHGTEAPEVLALGAELDLLRPLAAGLDHLEAEVAWAARRELARSVDDVLARRMRLAQEMPDRGAAIAPRVAEILAGELGWDDHHRSTAVAEYLVGARREYGLPTPATGSS